MRYNHIANSAVYTVFPSANALIENLITPYPANSHKYRQQWKEGKCLFKDLQPSDHSVGYYKKKHVGFAWQYCIAEHCLRPKGKLW